ncbi:MAG: CU044_5270 family protein, partial [Microbacterium sp.]
MSEHDPLIRRLADANPVPDHEVEGSSESEAASLLLSQIEEGGRRTPRLHTRRRRRLAAAAAVVLVLAVAAGFLLRTATRTPATAAELLRRTAAVAYSQPAPSARGRYVYSKIKADVLKTSAEQGQVWTAVQTQVEETWIAPDGSGRIRSQTGEARFPGPRDQQRWLEAGSPLIEAGTFDEVFPAGTFVFVDTRDLPTDTSELLNLIAGQVAEEDLPPAVAIFQRTGELLTAADAPPDLRAALYRVAAGLPGVQLVGDVRDPLGRPGTGVGIT